MAAILIRRSELKGTQCPPLSRLPNSQPRCCNQAVSKASPCHGKHLTVEELALELRGAFNLEIFVFG